MCCEQWFPSSQILCKDPRQTWKHIATAQCDACRRKAGCPRRSRDRFLEHWLRSTIMVFLFVCLFLFSKHWLFLLVFQNNKGDHTFFSFSYFCFQCRSQRKVRMHCSWALSRFLPLFIKVRNLLDIRSWAGRMCLCNGQVRFPERPVACFVLVSTTIFWHVLFPE